MFSFIKKIFARQQPAPPQSMTLEELEQWLSSQEQQEQLTLSQILGDFEEGFSEIKEKIEHLLDQLQHAQLQNTNIPSRAIHFMEGNRESYIRFVRLFLRDISVKPKENEIDSYCQRFSMHLTHFASASTKNYYVLNNFFAHTMRDLASSLKELEAKVKQLQDALDRTKLKSITHVREGINQLKSMHDHKQQLKKDVQGKRQEMEQAKENFHQSTVHKDSLQHEGEFLHFKELKHQLKRAQDMLTQEQQTINAAFSPLEKALKKYSKEAFEHHGLIEHYAENPAAALKHDDELTIISILDRLSAKLTSNGLGLDDKRTQKAMAAVKVLTRDYVKDRQQKLRDMSEQMDQLQHACDSSPMLREEEKRAKAQEIAQANYERKKQELLLLQEQEYAINKETIAHSIQETMKKDLEKEIVLLLPQDH